MKTIIITMFASAALFYYSTLLNSGTANAAPQPTAQKNADSKLVISIKPLKLEAPPFKGQFQPASPKAKPVKLKLLSQKANQITDEENWFSSNSLSYPSYTPPNPFVGKPGELPAMVPEKYENMLLTDCFYDNSFVYMIYGNDFSDRNIMFISDKNVTTIRYGFDFINYAYSPEYVSADKEFIFQSVIWAVSDNGVLYVSHTHMTYAASSNKMNAYITAIDLKTNGIIWRSQPLISNSRNFIVEGDVIITGYGFTQEKDFIYLLDKYSGKVMNKIKLKSAPEMFVKKDNKLYVRTYDTDYVFEIK